MKLAPSSETFRVPEEQQPRTVFAQEMLSSREIFEKLEDGKALHDAMFRIEDLMEKRWNILTQINEHRMLLNKFAHIGTGTAHLRQTRQAEIDQLMEENKLIMRDIDLTKRIIEKIFDQIEEEGDVTIKKLVQRRRDLVERLEANKCDGIGRVDSVCTEVDAILNEVTLQILVKHTEHYWADHSLKEFVPTETFLHPGAYQAHPAFLDIKAVFDESQDVAIVAPHSETEGTDELIAQGRLSVLFVSHPEKKIVYRSEAIETARQLASLLETRGNHSKDPKVVYNYFMRMGKLLDQPGEVRRAYALRKARRIKDDFEPLFSEN